MQKLLLGLLICFLSGLITVPCLAQQIVPQTPESGELITPVNAQPLSLETVTRRRGIVTDGPAKNLIIFSCSGLSGASAAFFDAHAQRKRDAVQWQGFQLVYPTWTAAGKPGRLNIIKNFSNLGKRLGLVSDKDFAVPSFIHGLAKRQTADLSLFNVALTFSGFESTQARGELIAKSSGNGSSTGLDFASLENFFRENSLRFIGCFYSPATMMPGSRPRTEPWVPELVSSLLGRLSLAQEGFCLVVNYSGVSDARNNGQFCRMLEHMRFQETILRQLGTFVAGRKDTLLLVVDEPENGVWKMGNDFLVDAFIADLSKVPAVVKEMADNPGSVGKMLGQHFPEINIADTELAAAIAGKDANQLITAIEHAVSRKHQIEFISSTDSGFNSGLTVLAQGLNADVFFGISSFPVFFKRLAVATGLDVGEE